MATHTFGTVAVVGGSIAGLLAARVLADHAREVVLIERDRIGEHPSGPRKGVPQAHHAHAMLASGQRAIESLCPGWTRSLLERGALVGAGSYYTAGGYLHAPARDGSLFASRPLIEAQLRRLVLARPNLRLLDGWQADAPCLCNGRVVGLHAAPLDSGGSREIAAELVVDASGRGSRSTAWLASSGFAAPSLERVEVGMRYASRLVRRTARRPRRPLVVQRRPVGAPAARVRRAGARGRRLARHARRLLRRSTAGRRRRFHRLRAQPAGTGSGRAARARRTDDAIRTFAFAANQRVRHERAAPRPPGWLAIGDALASFSPVYGQGMSVAALQALALRDCLTRADRSTLQARYFRAAAKVIDTPWAITVGNDRQLAPGGPHGSWLQRARHRWVQRVLRAGHHDRHVASAFLGVARLISGPGTLLRPDVALRVWWATGKA